MCQLISTWCALVKIAESRDAVLSSRTSLPGKVYVFIYSYWQESKPINKESGNRILERVTYLSDLGTKSVLDFYVSLSFQTLVLAFFKEILLAMHLMCSHIRTPLIYK